MEVERRRLAKGENKQMSRPSRREIPDFESWLQCFSSYTAVVGSKYPHKCKELWAYQSFMTAEHRKCGGRGWLLYDSTFRQQMPSLEEAGLYFTTILAYGAGLADAIQWIFEEEGIEILHYLDDFLSIGAPDSPECEQALESGPWRGVQNWGY